MIKSRKIAVVLPCYRSAAHAPNVVQSLPKEVDWIIAVDDACPEKTGNHLLDQCGDNQKLIVLFHQDNQGVGGATITGMKHAIDLGADIVVKIDSDGQIDPNDVKRVAEPIAKGHADVCKGNRFYDPRLLRQMPIIRLMGNSALSFMTKWSSGYWNVFDPTNGLVAIHAELFKRLPHDKLERRYFFESDLLFQLYLLKAFVQDVPNDVTYGSENSGISIAHSIPEFFLKNIRNGIKRIVLTYFIRDFRVASLQILVGIPLSLFGLIYGLATWVGNSFEGTYSSAGEVMLASLPIIIGMQLLLSAAQEDIMSSPRTPVHGSLS
ncbi:glycosyltransferase family 2 protein [Hyphobacterium sp. HN65]|uniref:Glycosyltransferase family 2 protein n=1 Tax=Hyphobacterium lacteum TaxID=3116575 RepID=A0ABU7LSH9_9PROT|nr:glycosyltransferase family 2 protein [Hyphobacterium sp. HN65]MEE2526864.1 glycosyltransferase family 2 protein [Hyphobacterium sp. HN65]